MSSPPIPVAVPAVSAPVASRGILSDPILSVVVPVRNEAANIAPLIEEIRAALAGVAHEIVYVDDGSDDGTAEALLGVAPPLVLRRHARRCGQSAAIVTGVRAARGEWIATLDGDGQNDPADIPALLTRAIGEAGGATGMVLIAGHRTQRRDSAIKRASSRVANRLRAAVLGDGTPDTGCGLKVFRRALFMELPAFDHMHRFLPALVIRAGGHVVSVPVNHRPRLRGVSKYGTIDRALVGIVDLAGVAWLQRRWTRPELVALRGPPEAGHPAEVPDRCDALKADRPGLREQLDAGLPGPGRPEVVEPGHRALLEPHRAGQGEPDRPGY